MKTETEKFEVKFRGERVGKKGFIYGMPTYDLKYIFNKDSINSPDDYEVIPETVGQYMNFKDKNDVDVYLDDIVMDEMGRIMKVGYFNYQYCLIAITETNFHDANLFYWIWEDRVLIEVIGNIHQNPELLNPKNP